MKYLTPQKIAEATGGEYVGSESTRNTRVDGAVRDNREVKPGNLFVCIQGARVDGHDYANSAITAGAACCLAEHSIQDAKGPYVLVESTQAAIKSLAKYYRSLFSIPVIGITGSVGKTTAKEMVAAVLRSRFDVLKTPENLNNELGVSLTLLSMSERHEAAVVEMGISEFGEMSRLADMVRPDICVMTRIGYAHLESLGDLNGVLRAKSEVFSFMKPDGAAILNGDDELLREFDPGIRKITFGLNERNDIRAENIRADGTASVSCDVVSGAGRFPIVIPAYGAHMVPAALTAVAAGRLLGLSDREMALGIRSYLPVGGRSNISRTGFITLIDDCYNANPNSLRAALKSLASLPGRHVAVLGDMLELGEASDALHRELGVFAAQSGIDSLVCCGDKATHLFDGYLSAGGKGPRCFSEKDELIAALPELIKKDDAVLVKASHGMKFEEILPALRELGRG